MTRRDKHLGPLRAHMRGQQQRLRELKATLDKHQKKTRKTKKDQGPGTRAEKDRDRAKKGGV